MFSSSKKASGRDRNARGMPSIISAELRITGDLVCQGDVMIEGVVEGSIKCQSVTVGESATIAGEIECETARICGRVKGRISGTAITLTPTARVVGDIQHETIAIETGAYFEGQLRHHEAHAAAEARHAGEPSPASEAAIPGAAKPETEFRPLSVVAAPGKPPREPKSERAMARGDAHPNGKTTGAH